MKLLLLLTEALDINDPKQVAERIKLYQRIERESNGIGEREQARNLLNKLIIAAKAAGTYRDPATEKPSYSKPNPGGYKYKPKPGYKPYQSYSKPKEEPKEEPKKEQPKADSNPSAFKVVFVGHYEDFSNNHNKVWGWGTKNGKIYQFWGRYNGTPSIKMAGSVNDLSLDSIRKLAKTKAAKGYEQSKVEFHKDWLLKVLDAIRAHENA